MTEREIIHLALQNLQKQTQIVGKWTPIAQKDLDGKLHLKLDEMSVEYQIEIKKEWRNHHLPLIETLNNTYPPFMVVGKRLFPKIKEALRNQNIAYLEANGNIFLKHNGQLVWVEANAPIPTETKTGNRAFTKTGLKVLFQFLQDETWINKPYRQIAGQTGTTIGNITHIITGLKQDGFLLPIAKNEYKFQNKKELLHKWAVSYDQRLKPTLKIGSFSFLKAEDFINWKTLPLQTAKTRWGGEPAADWLSNYLRPAELTLYSTETRSELIKNYRLIPDENGNVKAYQLFWQPDESSQNNYPQAVAPPLLVYADLINANDRRCTETAQKIYEDYLQDKF